jgi:Zn-dependent protease
MTNCSLCGKEDLTFTCPYCNGTYCGEHRLPESHGCVNLQLAKDDARRKIASSFTGAYEDEDDTLYIPRSKRKKPKPRRRKRFSEREMRDLSIASILVILVGISALGAGGGIIFAIPFLIEVVLLGLWWIPAAIVVIFLLTFLVHELAHKFAAQHYGMWSEFRMLPQGYILSALAILVGIPIFGTGVVLSSGARNQEEDSKVNLAGPLVNLVLAVVFATAILVIGIVSGVPLPPSLELQYLVFILRQGIILNGMLGAFNMIPVPPFDGVTVYRWDRTIWVIVMIALVSMILFGYFITYVI